VFVYTKKNGIVQKSDFEYAEISENGGLAQLAERVLSMHEVQDSISWSSIFLLLAPAVTTRVRVAWLRRSALFFLVLLIITQQQFVLIRSPARVALHYFFWFCSSSHNNNSFSFALQLALYSSWCNVYSKEYVLGYVFLFAKSIDDKH
jgi:hypothetical protein